MREAVQGAKRRIKDWCLCRFSLPPTCLTKQYLLFATTANKNIWDQDDKDVTALKDFEASLSKKAGEDGFDVNVIRSGTLKGGGWGSTDPMSDEVPSTGPEVSGQRAYDAPYLYHEATTLVVPPLVAPEPLLTP